MTTREQTRQDGLQLKSWELNALTIEAIFAGGGLMAAIAVGGSKLFEGVITLPLAVWLGFGFFALFWAIVPVLNVHSRSQRGRDLPLVGTLVASILGAAVGGACFALLS